MRPTFSPNNHTAQVHCALARVQVRNVLFDKSQSLFTVAIYSHVPNRILLCKYNLTPVVLEAEGVTDCHTT